MHNGTASNQQLYPSKSGCPKCNSKKLPACICSKGGSGEKVEEEFFEDKEIKSKLNQYHTSNFVTHDSNFSEDADKVEPQLLLCGQKHQLQLTLKPGISLADIKELLEKFIQELANNSNTELSNQHLTIKELGIYYTDSEQESLVITIENQEHFAKFLNRLVDNNLIEIPQELKQTMDNLTPEETHQSFNPSPFTMTFTPY